MKRLISITLFFSVLFLFSCTENKTGSGGTVTLSIYGYEETIIENHTVTVDANTTAFDLFSKYMRENKLAFTVSGSGSTVYIKSVNGVKEFDHGPESGWVYTVNGEQISQSCGAYQLNENDSIVFKYITEYEDII